MVAIAHSIIGDRHLAEDAAQQAFADAVRKLPQLRKKDKFAAWLTTICRNAAFDLARKTDAARAIEDISTVAAELDTSDAAQAVKDAVAKLSASEREIIFLRFYDGMPYRKISDVLGISDQAINGRLRRAKKKIARYLTRSGFDEVSL
jgi:RNA polymerase sigma-70 factor (ECF subfamily)